ncbi:hypothetical protein [Novipirellula rosea]|uniref:hypothetical protein n=1 Tax=Novipirellula rosea TaxID=1031540 RepID=UPI0031E62692
MRTKTILLIPLAMIVTLTTIGCEENENRRLADMSERHEQRQAEQNRQATKLHRDMVALQHDVQSERAEIGQQRDALETERHSLASERRWDSLVAAAITNVGLLIACLLPLALAWLLLVRPPETGDEQVIVEIMLDDLTASRPLLLHRSQETSPRHLTDHDEKST